MGLLLVFPSMVFFHDKLICLSLSFQIYRTDGNGLDHTLTLYSDHEAF